MRLSLNGKRLLLCILIALFVAGMPLSGFPRCHVNAFSTTGASFGDVKQGVNLRLASAATVLSTNVDGYVVTDSTWTLGGSPYNLVADVVVAPEATLTIEPGVIVNFSSGTGLIVDGGLVAEGNSTHPITFTSAAASDAPGDWKGISIRQSGFCSITNAVIEYATTGLGFDSINFDRQSILEQTTLRSNVIGLGEFGFAVISNWLIIEDNIDCGVYVESGDLAISNSLISQNNVGIRGDYGAITTMDNCTVSNNLHDGISTNGTGINNCLNSKIENNGGKGVYLYNGNLGNCRNTVIANNSGDGVHVVKMYGSATIYNSTISFNNGDGVYTEFAERSVTISRSIISSNTGNGVVAHAVDISHSSIINNGNNGVLSTGTYYQPGVGPNRDIHYCNLYGNGGYEVKDTGAHLNADYNWWGTSNEGQIAMRVYDYFDNSSITGIVNCRPFLNASSATLTLLTNGVPSAVSAAVSKDGVELGDVNDDTPLTVTLYSGAAQPEMGWCNIGIDSVKNSSDNNTTCTFVNWAGPEGNSTSNPINLLVASDTVITAFYDTKIVPEFPLTMVFLLIVVLTSSIAVIAGRKHRQTGKGTAVQFVSSLEKSFEVFKV